MYSQQVCDMSPYRTLVIALHLRAFFIIHAHVWTMIKEYELEVTASHKNSLLSSAQKSAPVLEDGGRVLCAESISRGGVGMGTVSEAVLERSSKKAQLVIAKHASKSQRDERRLRPS